MGGEICTDAKREVVKRIVLREEHDCREGGEDEAEDAGAHLQAGLVSTLALCAES